MKATRQMTKAFLGGGFLFLLLLTFAGAAAAQTWTQLTVTGGPPDVRSGHTAVYNQARNRMIVFGGRNPTGIDYYDPSVGLRNDVWVLSNADGTGTSAPTWIAVTPTGGPPSRRAQATSVYDPNSNRMIVFGGNPNEGFCFGTLNDLWVLSNADGTEASTPAWIQVSPMGGPPSRRWIHTAGYDPATNRMIVFGGADACVDNNVEVWVLYNANGLGGTPAWTELVPGGTPPTPGVTAKGVYDPGSNVLIVVSNPGGLVNVRILTNANGLGGAPTWFDLSPTGGPPAAVAAHSASLVYDPVSNRLIEFGGCCGPVPGGRINEAWALSNANGTEPSTPAWTKLNPTGALPLGRYLHTAVFNPTTNRMTVFGGTACVSGGACTSSSEFSNLNDVWVLAGENRIVEIPVAIDVEPGINPKSRGVTPVAILTTATFNAATVDSSTVRFGKTGTEASPAQVALEDVNGDGLMDMVLHFHTQQTGIVCGTTSASLTGKTLSGQAIKGSDPVNTVGCK